MQDAVSRRNPPPHVGGYKRLAPGSAGLQINLNHTSFATNCFASRIADNMLEGFASPRPAMSYAVP